MSNRIYIGNLNNDISKFELEEFIQQFGTVVDMLYKNTYAFVEFSKYEEAEEALKKLDGFLLKGRRIKAQMAKALNQNKEAQVTTNRLYVGRILEANITKYDLQQLFEPYGEIEDILLKEDYAFIQYKNLDSAQRAKQLHNSIVNGQKIVVQEAKNRDAQMEIGSTRLFIGRITPEITREDIMQLFSPFGEILDVNMKQDFAFVEYSNKASALQALQKLDQFSIKGTRIQVQEAKGPKKDRNKQSHQNSKYSKNSSKNQKHQSKRNSRRDRSSSYSSGGGSYHRSYSRSRSRSRDRRRGGGGRGNQNQQQGKYQKQNFQQRQYQQRGNYQGGVVPQQTAAINQQQQLSAFYQQLNQQNPSTNTIASTNQLTGLSSMIPPQQDMMSYYQQSTIYKPQQQTTIPILQQQQPVQFAQQQQLWQRLNTDKADF